MTKLNIKGIKIYAFHGHFEEEKSWEDILL